MRTARGLAGLFEFEEFEDFFDFRLDTLRPFGWRRIDFPKGDHRRPPAFGIRRFEEKFFGITDFGDVGDCECLERSLRAIFRCFAASGGGLGSFLEPLWALLGRSWALLGGSWGLFGGS